MKQCACGSALDYTVCCEPYLDYLKTPPSPESLMRSRYTAYSMGNIAYIKKTMCGNALNGFNHLAAERWAKRVIWINLCVKKTALETSTKGYVEFVVTFIDGDKLKKMHEVSEFALIEGQWFYIDGVTVQPTKPLIIQKIVRNSNCPCGSLRKFKNCHGK